MDIVHLVITFALGRFNGSLSCHQIRAQQINLRQSHIIVVKCWHNSDFSKIWICLGIQSSGTVWGLLGECSGKIIMWYLLGVFFFIWKTYFLLILLGVPILKTYFLGILLDVDMLRLLIRSVFTLDVRHQRFPFDKLWTDLQE